MSGFSESRFLRTCAIVGTLLSAQMARAASSNEPCDTGLQLAELPDPSGTKYLGVFVYRHLPGSLEVSYVKPGSMADRAGLSKGDQIKYINDRDVEIMNGADLDKAVAEAKMLQPLDSMRLIISGYKEAELTCP